MTENRDKNLYDTLYLAACALNGCAPDRETALRMDFDRVYALSRFHSIAAVCCAALESGGFFEDGTVDSAAAKKFSDEKNKSIRRNILLDAERAEIINFLEENGIRYLPLKGIIIKDLYPKPGMRQMSDNDILVDSEYRNEIKSYMKARGYTLEKNGGANHDAYTKPPVYNFEIHMSLFNQGKNEELYGYYKDIWNIIIRDSEASYGYHFSDGDYYIYMLLHAYKHYCEAGVGLRILLDCYVYMSKKGASLDRAYISARLKKLNADGFEANISALSQKLFSSPQNIYDVTLTQDELRLLDFLSGSGTYGTVENTVKKNIAKLKDGSKAPGGRLKAGYYLKRLFPDKEWFRANAPFCYRHKWAIPFYDIYRLFRGVLFRRKKLKKEISAVEKYTENKR